MKLTNKLIEEHGFKRINNSMFRLNNITLQNTTSYSGKDIVERILSMEKAYKVCVDGKYNCTITTDNELSQITLLVSAKKLSNLLLNEAADSEVRACGSCKYCYAKGKCNHPQGCEGDYEFWEQAKTEA